MLKICIQHFNTVTQTNKTCIRKSKIKQEYLEDIKHLDLQNSQRQLITSTQER